MSSPSPKMPVRVRRRITSTIKDPELARATAAFAPQVNERRLSDLKASLRNARTHSPKQIHQIAESIRAFGFVAPIVADANGEIVAGHGRYEAAKLLDLPTVPVISIGHLGPQQIRALRITDNKLAELSGWDDEILKLELGELIDLDFEVDVIGFEVGEIDVLVLRVATLPHERHRLRGIDLLHPRGEVRTRERVGRRLVEAHRDRLHRLRDARPY